MPVKRPNNPQGGDGPPHRRAHGHGPGDVDQASRLLGYDIVETKLIEADVEFHARVVNRLESKYPGELVPAEQVFGSLDE
ncbi:MAG TPA: hypothetical protein VMY78_13800 [Solirubrobacteraceae bacterium]|nr:hypothetical protein [Solirubrobacteraceae bacterium]